MSSTPSPIPVVPGDDWSWLFAYTDTTGTAIDLTGCTVAAELYYASSATPLVLTVDQKRALIQAPPSGIIAIGLEAEQTQGITPDPQAKYTRLRIELTGPGGLTRTIAIWPILVLDPHLVFGGPLTVLSVTDPTTGNVLAYLGPADSVPGTVGVIDFSNFLNSGLIARL